MPSCLCGMTIRGGLFGSILYIRCYYSSRRLFLHVGQTRNRALQRNLQRYGIVHQRQFFSRVSDVSFSIMLQRTSRVFLNLVLIGISIKILTLLLLHVSVKFGIYHDLQPGGATRRTVGKLLSDSYRVPDQSTPRTGGGQGVRQDFYKLLSDVNRLSDQSQDSVMRKTIELLNWNKTTQDDPHLLNTIREIWLRPPTGHRAPPPPRPLKKIGLTNTRNRPNITVPPPPVCVPPPPRLPLLDPPLTTAGNRSRRHSTFWHFPLQESVMNYTMHEQC